jgi:hypothetical protein
MANEAHHFHSASEEVVSLNLTRPKAIAATPNLIILMAQLTETVDTKLCLHHRHTASWMLLAKFEDRVRVALLESAR